MTLMTDQKYECQQCQDEHSKSHKVFEIKKLIVFFSFSSASPPSYVERRPATLQHDRSVSGLYHIFHNPTMPINKNQNNVSLILVLKINYWYKRYHLKCFMRIIKSTTYTVTPIGYDTDIQWGQQKTPVLVHRGFSIFTSFRSFLLFDQV